MRPSPAFPQDDANPPKRSDVPASDVAFTPTVKAIQAEKGSRETYARMEQRAGWETTITEPLREFVATLDMFYLGTANAAGQPYIQYRGGPAGFLKSLNDTTLGFADFGGNQQYITAGNLQDNPQAFLFLMDYQNRRRTKVWGTAEVVENDSDLLQQLHDRRYPAHPERAILFHVHSWDINCPQHIHSRVPTATVAPVMKQLQTEIADLRQRLAQYEDEDMKASSAGDTGKASAKNQPERHSGESAG